MFTPSVRHATGQDALLIAAHRYPELDETHEARRVYTDWVRCALERGTYRGVLVEVDEVVVAGAGLTLLDWGPTKQDPHPLRGRVVNVYTTPHWRRRGLARLAVESVLREAHDQGLRTLNLGTTDAAHSLYTSLGFVPYPHEMLRRAEH